MTSQHESEFAHLTKNVFAFLECDYHFTIVEVTDRYMRFENTDVLVDIHHGRVSQEVGLRIGLVENGINNAFGIGTLIEVSDESFGSRFRYRSADFPEQIEEPLQELAALLKKHGDAALRGDRSVFEKMRAINDAYWAQRRATQLRVQASAAFLRKDYRNAARLFQSFSNELTEVDRRKLEYALKHVNADSQ